MAGPDGKIVFGNRDADEVNSPVEQDGVYRIVIDVTDRENMTYTIELVEAGLPEPAINVLYMIGDAVDTGWSLDLAEPFTYSDGILTWEGNLKANSDFRMNVSNLPEAWFPAIVLKEGTDEAVYCEVWDETQYDQFRVDKAGVYKVTVDASDMEAITYTITYMGEGTFEPEPEKPVVKDEYFVKELYMLGPAYDGAYNVPANDPNAAFTYDDGIWTWEGDLTANIFRFQTQKVDFIPALFMGAADGTLVYVDSYEAANTATHLSVAEAGTYRIVVDGRSAESLTYTITKL